MNKLNCGSRILLTLVITIGLLAAASGQIPKCAGIGEYCQNHWECCSNTCMSYLYKCVRNYNIYPYTFLSYAPPRTTVEDILELNFGVNSYVRPNSVPQPIGVYERFLTANEVVPNNQVVVEVADLQTPLTQPITEAAATQPIAATTPVIQTVSRLSEIVPITTAINASASTSQSPSSKTTAPAAPAAPPASATESAAMSTITLSSTTTTPLAKCSEIGVKCYRNEECCTQRCHGFLHQCVT